MKHLITLATIFILTSMKFVSAQDKQDNNYYWAEINSIYDGDTFTVMIELGFETYKLERIRIARIDAPEVRGFGKAKGIISRDALIDKLNSGYCYIIYKGRDKYGRALAEVYTPGDLTNISDWMIKEGYAVEYK